MTNPPIGASSASGSFQAPDEPPQPTPQGSEGLVEQVRTLISDAQDSFDFDASQAFDGDRTDLWDVEAEVSIGLLRALADRIEALEGERDSAVSQSQPSGRRADALSAGLNAEPSGEEFLEFKEALDDLRSLRAEHRDLNGGGPGWSGRWEAAWAKANDLFANEDEAAHDRHIESFYG